MRRTAFTLLELLIVLAIITTLFGLGYSSFRRQLARSQFKNGVFEFQIDLARTRLLAMKTGTPYLVRFVPGSGVYEIAPVKTLQEAIYRQTGDFGDATDTNGSTLGGSLLVGASGSADVFGVDSFGGSAFADVGLAGASSGASEIAAETGDWSNVATGGVSASRFADDLFSPENIAADVASFRATSAFRSQGEMDELTGGVNVGGGLGTPTGATEIYSTSGAEWNGGTPDEFSNQLGVSAPTTLRDLNVDEKPLATDALLAWRVNGDGAIFRKELTGDVVFTFERISKSTPSNLKTRRPGGLSASNGGAAGVDESAGGPENLGSEWTGSLSQAPGSTSAASGGGLTNSGALGSDGVSGGLTGAGVFDGANVVDESTAPANLWAEPIVFYPNGRTSTAVLGLACVGDFQFYSEIALRGMTGVARVSAISSLAPGVDPTASALTQEELFRLTNPDAFAANVGDPSISGSLGTNGTGTAGTIGDSNGALSGGAFGDVSTGNVVEGSGSGTAEASNGSLLDGGFPASNGVDSSSRRSGYRFDVAPNQNANAAPPIGVLTDSTAPTIPNGTNAPRNDDETATNNAVGGGAL